MATNRRLISNAPGLLLVLVFSGPVLAADPAECDLTAVSDEFEWSREFQGVSEPITWKISRQVRFQPAHRQGQATVLVSESLQLDLPEFRSRFQRYLSSAVMDSCEMRFSARARTLTARGQELRMPFVVEYELASCKNYNRMCRNNGIDFHTCEKFKRKIRQSDAAEIDVSFSVDLEKPGLNSVVGWQQTPYYNELKIEQARSFFEQVLDDGSTALAFITGTLGQVSIGRIGGDINAFRVIGEFTSYDGSSYQANASYRLSPTQACQVHAAISKATPAALPGK